MRKSLFAIGLLAAGYSVQAQNILCHVDTNANMYVSKGTLVYSGGGMQMKGNGRIENHGNINGVRFFFGFFQDNRCFKCGQN
ncbi:UNVERIFIED_CONTAM: hypothetical protein QE387_001694 [Pseudacidovorax intermedius]|nr:hypothetical protein [Pseudacidovorax intermedius]